MNHLIIGIGAAGVTAARTLLKENEENSVTIVSEDTNVISRCMLHRYLSGERTVEGLNFINDGLLENPRLTWIKGKTVTKLDGSTKTVYAGDEKLGSGDTVIIATGSNSVTPPIGELKTAKNAFGLRHLQDAVNIVAAAKTAEKIAIIGAGLVGMDAASALVETGKKLTIIDVAPTIMAINLDDHATEPYRKSFEEHGCTFHLGCKVMNTQGDGKGNITGLELDSGKLIPCDLVIVAVGVRPATAFLEGSGITVERAVVVNDKLETNMPGIYAAGDVAGLSGIWPNAQKQGEIAAKNISGWDMLYEDRYAMKNTVNFFGLVSLSIGSMKIEDGDEVLKLEDRNVYKRLVLHDGAPTGVILQGDIANSGFWQHLIKNKIRIDNLGKSPWKVSYADFYDTETNGEYRYKV
jgi:NAD(P)H-nitrite reductase large subunit